MIYSIDHSHSKLSSISKYNARMKHFFSIGVSKEHVKDLKLNKTKFCIFQSPLEKSIAATTFSEISKNWDPPLGFVLLGSVGIV